MKTFHHSSLDSPRLSKLLAYLRSCGAAGATTLQITIACTTTRASSDVSELAANGVAILTRYDGATDTGRKVYRYILAECVPGELTLRTGCEPSCNKTLPAAAPDDLAIFAASLSADVFTACGGHTS